MADRLAFSEVMCVLVVSTHYGAVSSGKLTDAMNLHTMEINVFNGRMLLVDYIESEFPFPFFFFYPFLFLSLRN